MYKHKKENFNKTIFRVVGGFSNRKSECNDYEIITYDLVNETSSMYFYEGRRSTMQGYDNIGEIRGLPKRETTNTKIFETVHDALAHIQSRIKSARESIQSSLDKILDEGVEYSFANKVFVVIFKEESFFLYRFTIAGETRNAIKVEEKSPFRGGQYLQRSIAKPHDPASPYERWMQKDFHILKSYITLYAEERLRYLHRCEQKAIDFVRQYEMREKYRRAKTTE